MQLLLKYCQLCISFGIFLMLFNEVRPQQQRHWISAYDPRWRRYEDGSSADIAGAQPYGYHPMQFHQPMLNYAPYYNAMPQRPAPAYYPIQSQRTSTPQAELAKYRHEGNYIRRIPGPIPAPAAQQPQTTYQQQTTYQPQITQNYSQRRMEMETPAQKSPAASYANSVVHVEPEPEPGTTSFAHADDYRHRLYSAPQARIHAAKDALAAESTDDLHDQHDLPNTETEQPTQLSQDPRSTQETRHFHDIYMRYHGPQSISFGHVEDQPKQKSRRFETQQHGQQGQRYKGEVFWADRQGGYGAQQWNLAQGRL